MPVTIARSRPLSLPREFVQRLQRACATYFGTAGPAFVQFPCLEGTTAELCNRVQQELVVAHRLLGQRAAPATAGRFLTMPAPVRRSSASVASRNCFSRSVCCGSWARLVSSSGSARKS